MAAKLAAAVSARRLPESPPAGPVPPVHTHSRRKTVSPGFSRCAGRHTNRFRCRESCLHHIIGLARCRSLDPAGRRIAQDAVAHTLVLVGIQAPLAQQRLALLGFKGFLGAVNPAGAQPDAGSCQQQIADHQGTVLHVGVDAAVGQHRPARWAHRRTGRRCCP